MKKIRYTQVSIKWRRSEKRNEALTHKRSEATKRENGVGGRGKMGEKREL